MRIMFLEKKLMYLIGPSHLDTVTFTTVVEPHLKIWGGGGGGMLVILQISSIQVS